MRERFADVRVDRQGSAIFRGAEQAIFVRCKHVALLQLDAYDHFQHITHTQERMFPKINKRGIPYGTDEVNN
jgi:hypothetical protein